MRKLRCKEAEQLAKAIHLLRGKNPDAHPGCGSPAHSLFLARWQGRKGREIQGQKTGLAKVLNFRVTSGNTERSSIKGEGGWRRHSCEAI